VAAQNEKVVYWWRGKLYGELEAPPLAIPLRLLKVEAVEWVCPRCGGKADWAPEPRCPKCGSRCQPRSFKEILPELPDTVEALERMLKRVCGAVRFGGAVELEPSSVLSPLFAWEPLDLELPDGSRLIGAYAGRARFLKAASLKVGAFPSESVVELPGDLCLVVWRSGFVECYAFECREAGKVLELLQRA